MTVARGVRLSAGEVRYREQGSGPPIVFIHGVLMNGESWSDLVPLLADRFRCICPDWPTGGHAVPLDPAAEVTPASLADLVQEFLVELELEDVTVVGIGLGTVLCEMMAIRHPGRLAGVVFANGDILSTFPPGWARRRFAIAFAPPLGSAFVRLLRARWMRRRVYRMYAHRLDDRFFESFTRGITREPGVRRDTLKLMRAICRGRTGLEHDQLAGFDKPALIVWGADDTAFPKRHPDELARLLPQAQIELVPGAKTFLAQDQPERFADALRRFTSAL